MTANVATLTCRYAFPATETLGDTMYLGAGADLEPDTLLYAYSHGIFPWYEKAPILWCSPPERTILQAGKVHIPRSLRRFLRKNPYSITRNRAFAEVIYHCAKSRPATWITNEMIEAYCRLHALGFAESWEAWDKTRLVGGVYAVVINRAAALESTFHYADNAGKAAMVALFESLSAEGVTLFDFQVASELANAFGAETVSRAAFEKLLHRAMHYEP